MTPAGPRPSPPEVQLGFGSALLLLLLLLLLRPPTLHRAWPGIVGIGRHRSLAVVATAATVIVLQVRAATPGCLHSWQGRVVRCTYDFHRRTGPRQQ